MDRIPSVQRAELITVRLPLVKPFETSFGVDTHKEALLIRLKSEGIEGWGECVAAPDPYYAYETNATAAHLLRDFLWPLLKDLREFTVDEALNTMKRIRGHHMAKAALENALLDLTARRMRLPLRRLLGGEKEKIMSGISIGIQEDTDDLLNTIQHAVDKRYGRIKIKIKKGKDVDVLKTVRNHFPDIRLMADANADYTSDDAGIIKQFDAFDLMMIEQPLNYDDIYFHSFIQKEIKTPICLDESIKGLNDAKMAVAFKSCRIINIKQGRVGGLLSARAISEFCRENGIPVWSGGMLETGIGRSFNIHLQTLPGFTLPGDTSETARYFREDIVDRPVTLDADGYIAVPEGPGIGVTVVPEKLEKCTVHSEILS